jgi:AcrR family transcriptional regulator
MGAKGTSTRDAILHHAVTRAINLGLEGLSIGMLARELGMSKSGVFAHFKSKQGLQLAVIDHVADAFLQQTIRPALRAPRGRARLWALADSWLEWLRTNQFGGGCFFVAASAEFQGRPGPVRERLVAHQRDWLELIANVARTAIAEGTLPEGTDVAHFAYEFHAAGLIHQHAARFMDDPRAAELARETFGRVIPAAKAA